MSRYQLREKRSLKIKPAGASGCLLHSTGIISKQDCCHWLTNLLLNSSTFSWNPLYFRRRIQMNSLVERIKEPLLLISSSLRVTFVLVSTKTDGPLLRLWWALTRFMEQNLQLGVHGRWAQSVFLTHFIQINPPWHQTASHQTIMTCMGVSLMQM